MKILIFLMIFLVPFGVSADEIANKAIKAFIETSVQSFTESLLAKQLDRLASQMIDTTATETVALTAKESGTTTVKETAKSTYVSDALAVYGLYKSIDAYLDSQSQSDKYYAAKSAAASLVSFINPWIGSGIAISALGERMVGDALLKDRSLRLQRIYADIAEIQKQLKEALSKSYSAEFHYINSLFNSYEILITDSNLYQEGIAENCQEFNKDSDKQIFECTEMSLRSFYAFKQAVNVLNLFLKMKPGYLLMEDFLKFKESKVTIDQYKQQIEVLKISIAEKQAELHPMLLGINEALSSIYVESIRHNRDFDFGSFCYTNLLVDLNQFMKLDKDIIKAGNDIEQLNQLFRFRGSLLESSKIKIKNCSEAKIIRSKSYEQVNTLKSLLLKSHSRDFDGYLEEVFR